jgi:hypothetical protein
MARMMMSQAQPPPKRVTKWEATTAKTMMPALCHLGRGEHRIRKSGMNGRVEKDGPLTIVGFFDELGENGASARLIGREEERLLGPRPSLLELKKVQLVIFVSSALPGIAHNGEPSRNCTTERE